MAEDLIGCIVCARQAFFTPSDIVESGNGCRQVLGKLFAHHRIKSRPEMDVGQVPTSLFSHHRIQSSPKSDVEQVPNKFFIPSNFVETDKRW